MARLLTLDSEQLTIEAPHGSSIQQILDANLSKDVHRYTLVFLNGQMITDFEITVKESDSMLMTIVPQGGGGGGGKGILGAILTVAVIIAAVVLAAPTGGASLWLAGATGMSATTAGLVIGAGVSMLGMMAIQALIPPPSVNTGDIGSYGGAASSPTYSISGQSNAGRKYSPVTRVYGRHRVFPNLAANPIIENYNTTSRISALYDFGLGDLDITDVRIGDSPATNFSPELVWHKDSLVKNCHFVTRRVGYDQFSYAATYNNTITLQTKPETVNFVVDLSFPRGAGNYDNNGNPQSWGVDYNIYYRKVGDPNWIVFPGSGALFGGTHHYGGASTKPFVISLASPDLPAAQYEFQLTRIQPDDSSSRIITAATITMIKSFQDGTVVNLDKNHTMLEMRLVASDKISGVVQNLSAVATSVLRTTTDGTTFTNKATRNPAWICIDLLTGSGNRKPLADSSIDWPSWMHLANFCDAKGYTADFVVDYVTTVQELLNSVLSGCRASLMITTAGKYGVLVDEEKTIPRQLITPANSWGFAGTRTFADYPHAFRVGFINPDLNWQRDERVVYADGYDVNNATKYEVLETFGVTDKDLAWKYGRYMMAQGIHRSETFTITMDVENLVVQRGDLVHVANDAVKVGGQPCRVVSVSGSTVTVNSDLSTAPTGYSVRLSDGTTRTGSVTAAISGTQFTLDNAAGIDYGDLMVLGIMDRVVQPYLVQSIVPGADLTAEITMCKYVPEVYKADQGAIPPWNPGFGDDLINTAGIKVVNLTAKQEIIHIDRNPFNKITLNWNIDGFNAGETDVYYSIDGAPQIFLGSTDNITEQMLIDLLKQPQFVNKPVVFEVIPHSKSGVQGTSAKVTITPLPDTTRPLDIEGFSVNIQDMLVEIFWDQPKDKDIDHFECRYSPDPVNGSWNASQLIGLLPHNITKTSAGARTGKYFLQAIDTSGNRSNIAWQRTTVERLPNVNQIKVVNDQPLAWPGALSGVVKDAAGRIISAGNFGSVNPVGYYYYKDFIKFDAVYEVRVRSKIVGYGIHTDDIMAKWIPISIAKPLAKSSSAQWNAQLQVRTSDDSIVMADWKPTASAKPLNAVTNSWSEWRNITVSDETAKVMQFRVKMESFDPDIKVVMVDGRVEVDAADWIWRSNDVAIPAVGKDIVYSTPFMDAPVVSVTIDGSTTITHYEVTLKTRNGFHLKLLDQSNTAVAGQVDLAALGQGRQRLRSI